MKQIKLFCVIIVSILVISGYFYYLKVKKSSISYKDNSAIQSDTGCIKSEFTRVLSGQDVDEDGIDDQLDIYESALKRTLSNVRYIDKYYSSNKGKPPDNEGVCTDLFWRALEGAGYDFQEILHSDMISSPSDYPLEIWGSEPNINIDFRRVPNIEAYLEKYALKLSIELNKCDYPSLDMWQTGDIVIFSLDGVGPSDHIAIVSEKRDKDGIPYLIHNWGVGTKEDNNWYGEIRGHYRWKLN